MAHVQHGSGHRASYKSMDSFRVHSRGNWQSSANCTANCCPSRNHVSNPAKRETFCFCWSLLNGISRSIIPIGYVSKTCAGFLWKLVHTTRAESERKKTHVPRDEGNVDQQYDIRVSHLNVKRLERKKKRETKLKNKAIYSSTRRFKDFMICCEI